MLKRVAKLLPIINQGFFFACTVVLRCLGVTVNTPQFSLEPGQHSKRVLRVDEQLIGMAAAQIKFIRFPSPHDELKAFVRAADPDFLAPSYQAIPTKCATRLLKSYYLSEWVKVA